MSNYKAKAKELSSLIGRTDLEHSEYCDCCGNVTDIQDLNLTTGVCTTCKKTDTEKLKKLMEKVND